MDNVQILMKTEDRIVATALTLFNERGIEYVGLRELAVILDVHVGNITYYFPTKDDLVFRLANDLGKLNSDLFSADATITLAFYLDQLERMMRNQLKYKSLFLSFVHLMKNNPKLAAAYKKTERSRLTGHKQHLLTLAKNKELTFKSDSDIDNLTSTLSLILRFWISEAQISLKTFSEEEQVRHYLKIISALLIPYTTVKGRKELKV